MTTTTMYWITRLEGFNVLGIFMAIFGLALFTIFFIFSKADVWHASKNILTSFGVVGVLGLLICLFVPTTKEMAAIIIVPKIANSEKIQNLGNEVYDLAIDWMKEIKEGNKQ